MVVRAACEKQYAIIYGKLGGRPAESMIERIRYKQLRR